MSEIELVPPTTNRGVQTPTQNGLIACVDWLQVTFKIVQNTQEIFEIFNLDPTYFKDFPTGKYGYSSHLRMSNIAIYYGGRHANMGIHVEMTGQGCRLYESLEGSLSWDKLLYKIIYGYDVNITRFDLAIDDVRYNEDKPYFTVKKLKRKLKDGECVSKFKKAREMNTLDIASGESEGHTLYFGHGSSSIQIRIYEKHHERKNKGYELYEDLSTWNRVEIQARDTRALIMAKYVANESHKIGEVALGVLNNYVRFCVKNKNDLDHRYRWKTAPFWEKFLDGVKKLKLTMVAPDKTIETRKRWIEKQTLKTLAMVYHAHPDSDEYLEEIIQRGTNLITEDEYREVVQYREKLKEEEELTQYRKETAFNLWMIRTNSKREKKELPKR
ncbi:replication initiation factor domain-containing protein [Paenibacillus larvae]|uniref:Putative DNA relaxase NicK n=2 Tax=Paenibacillus larvae TaxID=1464 RepID=V9WDK4_9BACL|nr:replication initiation factor domain-containing protein [Paenibacillus larvae]AHD07785.1 putative DNA relaxase NicK [Paenibacillus larvae subsp. larvae DSM 25430]AVG14371.1 putative DNA relaxase NicK [Paenibacillus larvae subsp. larvae DSM 25430]MDR5570282.1 replication initiation factor domain-containing protein [Paenibacillus larvae]